ncbi:MAG TPA: three-Cys-motif partner protein TcmP [Kiritimatiellia bacterium]|nr:three-Cys-motif partner protein TcmP [Kiritimatiellia bacterium]HPS08533.1 three-Cys-motif partner protein TcmP [Kiritimatiellia bacterium]
MPNHSFHQKEFAESTKTKLALFRGYLEAWLPVFLNSPDRYSIVQVYDFFAGPGTDAEGNDGSPLIAIREIEAALETNKDRLSPKLRIRLILNDSDKKKACHLRDTLGERHFRYADVSVEVHDEPFAELFALEKTKMRAKGTANLIFIDQFGISEVSQDIFGTIAAIPSTDVLFFTSSAIVNRMKDHPSVQSNIPSLSAAELAKMNGKNVHRILSRSYRHWLPPKSSDYYLGDFSLKNKANVYGLVFGSRHILGILKFLQVAWELSETGDANYDIDDDHIDKSQPSLFAEFDRPTKIKAFESLVQKAIRQKHFRTNFDILRFTVENGMLPKHAKEAFQQAVKDNELPKQSLGSFAECWKHGCQTEIVYKGVRP